MRPGDEILPAIVRDALAPDETVLWQGRPIIRPRIRQAIPLICAALVPAFLIALSRAAKQPVAEADPWGAFAVIAPPACLAALIAVALHRRSRARTSYLITERQIFIASGAWRTSLMILDRPSRDAVTYTPRSVTEGTIHISLGMVDDGEGGLEERFVDLGVIADYRRPLALLLR